MFHPSTSRSRFGLVAAAVLVLLALSAGSVSADTTPPGDRTFTQNGTSADASGGGCTSNGDDTTTCIDVGLSVFVGKMTDSFSSTSHRNQICASVGTYTFDDATGEYVGDPVYESGCEVDLPNGTLSVGRNLTSVTLATTTISIQQYICDEFACEPGTSRDITVLGSWTGVGSTYSSKFRSSGDDGTCRTNASGKGSSRDASFVGTVDGLTLGEHDASITSGKFTFRSRCIEV